jgi:fibronectin type 3 domain-containing protein
MRYLRLFFLALPAITASGQVNITTWQADLQHTGANLNETILTPANVGSAGSFGLLFTQALDGQSYGQPLYVSTATLGTLPDGSSHNVVYVATEHCSVYAFDADSNPTGQSSAPLWHASLLPAGTVPVPQSDVGSGDIQVELGITTTPVIDPSSGTLYIVSKVKTPSNSTYQQYLYALDLKTGAPKFGSPVQINPTFAGSAPEATNGVVPFNPLHEHIRGAMTLYNGIVYIMFASHSDTQPYHGELLGYDAKTLTLVKTFISTPNGNEGGFWSSGAGPAIDTLGNMFLAVANGSFDQNASAFTTGTNWGESVLKLPTNTIGPISLSFSNPQNWFTPNNWDALNRGDLDLGSGGLLLLPDQTGGTHPHLLVGGGKGAVLYVLDRDNLGGLNTPDNAVQEIPEIGGHWLFVTPAYFNGNIYYSASGGPLEQRAVGFDPNTGNYVAPTPITSTKVYNGKGSGVFISASGNNNGIVWIANGNGVDAYNAANVSGNPIFSGRSTVPSGNVSTQNTKFSLPTVANGKVYYSAFNAATNTGYLFVSGLLGGSIGSPAAPSNLQVSGASSGSTVLTWVDNSNNETSFSIRRATAASGPFNQVGTVGANVTAFTDTGLTPQTTYYYQIAAINANGSSVTNVAAGTTYPIFTQTGLVAYWSLDALGPNNAVADITNNGHDGTANGESVFTLGGFINGAFTFHGTNAVSNISVPNSPAMQFAANQSFTLSAWVNPANLNGTEQPILAKSAGLGNQFGIFINAANNWVVRGPNGDLVGPAAVQGVWTHVAAVQDGAAGTRSLYVNGALVATGATQAADGAGPLVIGQASATGSTLGYEGIIDEVRLYNIALPPGGITALLGPPILEAVSNQTHGTAGTFGLILAPSAGPVVEPRKGSTTGAYSVALHFAAPVSTGITASLTLQGGGSAVGAVNSVSNDPSGTVVTVSLTAVANLQALNLHVTGINPGNGTADIPLNILWGDVNRDGVVNNLDVTTVQNSFTTTLDQTKAFYDVNADGVVNNTDAALVSAAVGTSFGTQTDTNLALFQPATTSSVTGQNVAARAFDNDPNTRWESVQGATADPSWLAVDLGTTAAIHQIVLNWENAAGANYQLQVSDDNVNWRQIVNVTGNTNGGIKTYSNLSAVGRYVRMYGTTRTTIYGYSLWEFQVFGIPVSGGGGLTPTITSPLTATGTVGTAFTYQIAATQNPTSYGATGLPAGLSLNTTSGAITGTPTTAGSSTVTITATNANGAGSANLTITIGAAPTAPPAPATLTATPGNVQVSLSWATSTGATSYSVFRGTASGAEGASPIAQNLTATTYVDSTVTNGTMYFYIVKAVNGVGSSPASPEASATPVAGGGSGTAVYQIAAGSTTGVASFSPDKFFTNGGAKTVTNTVTTAGVANAGPMQLYQSYRLGGGFTYTIPALTAGATYTVRLHFAETNFGAAGKRMFNVAINGAGVLSNFDIFAAAGGQNIAVVKSFTATANAGGAIVIAFSGGSADQPKVNGIEILNP